MHLYIPSLSRAGKIKTLDSLPNKWKKKCHLVVQEDQAEDYIEAYGERLVLVCPAKGIGHTRQWVLDTTKHENICFIDDDMNFHIRIGEDTKLTKCTERDVHFMLKLLSEWLEKDGLAHVGVSRRGGNNCVINPWEEVTRMNNMYGFNVEGFHKSGARFDRLPVMEDFDVTLTMLEAGLVNRVTYEWAWGQTKSGWEGGCSDYRTAEMQNKAAFDLARLHPGIVTVKPKKSKEKWDNIGNIRTDVIIHWKKAYKAPHQKASVSGFFKNG